MVALLSFVVAILALPFKSKIRLEAKNTALRHQMIVLLCQVCGRVRLTDNASPKTMKCCAGSFEPMLDITMTSERIGH
jgi:hypothetical protein